MATQANVETLKPKPVKVIGLRLDGEVPIIEGDGLSPQMTTMLHEAGQMGIYRLIRPGCLFLFVIGGIIVTYVWLSLFRRSGVEFLVLMGAYIGLCIVIDETYIKPLTRSADFVELYFERQSLRWNEGMEIGYLHYRDIDYMVSIDVPEGHIPGLAENAEQALKLLILEDLSGKRMGVPLLSSDMVKAGLQKIKRARKDLPLPLIGEGVAYENAEPSEPEVNAPEEPAEEQSSEQENADEQPKE
jgi:hypothetical protein